MNMGEIIERRPYLHSPCIRLNVNYIPNKDLFFKDGLIDRWIKAQLFGAFYSFEAHNNMRYSFSISAERIFGL